MLTMSFRALLFLLLSGNLMLSAEAAPKRPNKQAQRKERRATAQARAMGIEDPASELALAAGLEATITAGVLEGSASPSAKLGNASAGRSMADAVAAATANISHHGPAAAVNAYRTVHSE